ncbi:hypothetical protein O7626_32085 [Micromonospora sp. WMMD1102]|uniref:hypothetical protein n=1 Tax=Micromonospora sp. WMMD1102 TaxID=3016105 RepID=UPI002414E3FE|nr:hypothetical protein [Micromonospora sp. WMMD1102]MDG4790500.1 hypothetical protein [Micromonospora sp. WMMD1102]
MTQRTGQVSEERRGERNRHRPDIRYAAERKQPHTRDAAERKSRTAAAGSATGGPE